jgi:hypothetical protein
MPTTLAAPPQTPQATDAAPARPLHILPMHSDPRHAWLEVPAELIKQLGIGPQISKFSYMHHGKVYLEEDCDAPLFLEAANAAKVRYRVAFLTPLTFDSPIRCVPRWSPSVNG